MEKFYIYYVLNLIIKSLDNNLFRKKDIFVSLIKRQKQTTNNSTFRISEK